MIVRQLRARCLGVHLNIWAGPTFADLLWTVPPIYTYFSGRGVWYIPHTYLKTYTYKGIESLPWTQTLKPDGINLWYFKLNLFDPLYSKHWILKLKELKIKVCDKNWIPFMALLFSWYFLAINLKELTISNNLL